MRNYLQMHEDFEAKLGRDLTNDEVEFLQWVFNRYMEEKNQQTA